MKLHRWIYLIKMLGQLDEMIGCDQDRQILLSLVLVLSVLAKISCDRELRPVFVNSLFCKWTAKDQIRLHGFTAPKAYFHMVPIFSLKFQTLFSGGKNNLF